MIALVNLVTGEQVSTHRKLPAARKAQEAFRRRTTSEYGKPVACELRRDGERIKRNEAVNAMDSE